LENFLKHKIDRAKKVSQGTQTLVTELLRPAPFTIHHLKSPTVDVHDIADTSTASNRQVVAL
jgi:hypothetical protein